MAKHSKNLVGLDIDPSGITAAQVSANGRLAVEHAAVAELEPGVIRDGEVADIEGLSEALRALWKQHRWLGKHVRVGVANQKIVVRVVELPPAVEGKEMDAAVRFQAEQHIPMPLDSTVLDYQSLGVVDTPDGPRQRVVVVAARRDMIERLLVAVRGAGLRAEGIDLSAFAMVRALAVAAAPAGAGEGADGPDGPEHVLYLSVGGLTNLAVAQGTTCLFTRSSTGGLELLAVELAERRRLTLEHARAWLQHVGLEQPVDDVEGEQDIVLEARTVLAEGVRRIAADVRNTLDFHRGQGASGAVSRAVLTGPASTVPGFAAALESELGLPVADGALLATPEGLDSARLTVAAGLAVSEAVR
jgi:type IV pilus assembly protein PilM